MPSIEESENGVLQFQWGKRRGVGNANKDVQFYESFIYDEESYSLYDNVYLFKEGASEPYVGKILKIWEQPGHKRRVKVLWFFRPSDINVYLDGHALSEKELFLAAGEGIGLYNVNPLEAIAGKCFVICTSCDDRNPKPSNVAIENADFVFSRFFDVGTCTILERPPETIAGVELKFLLNNPEDQKLELIKLESVDPGVFDEKSIKQPSARTASVKLPPVTQNESDPGIRKPKIKPEVDAVKPVDNNIQRKVKPVDDIIKQAHDDQEKSESTTRKRKYVSDEDTPNNDSVLLPKVSSSLVELDAVKPVDNSIRRKVRPVDGIIKQAHDDQEKSESTTRKQKYVSDEDTPNNDSVLLPKVSSSLVELAEAKNNTSDALPPKPSSAALYRSRWFADMPWKARLEKAHKQGKLLFLDNLDPSYSSSEIEEFLLEALKIECSVKLIPQVTFHNPHYGQAYAICNTRDEANSAVQQIDEKCLILSDGRPVCAKLGMLDLPQKAAKFPGHLKIDKGRLQSARIEHKQAVATSHCSQPNTIEFELALDWLVILHKYQRCKEKLFKKHRGQLQAFLSKYTGK